uniref:Uncharacterized protein n=1 Tax=Trichogramma kaykai TaxID=54128 RepID=A0ABD2WEN8_9HYME
MGRLLSSRVRQAYAFENTGVDNLGPVYIKQRKFRNRTGLKTWIPRRSNKDSAWISNSGSRRFSNSLRILRASSRNKSKIPEGLEKHRFRIFVNLCIIHVISMCGSRGIVVQSACHARLSELSSK